MPKNCGSKLVDVAEEARRGASYILPGASGVGVVVRARRPSGRPGPRRSRRRRRAAAARSPRVRRRRPGSGSRCRRRRSARSCPARCGGELGLQVLDRGQGAPLQRGQLGSALGASVIAGVSELLQEQRLDFVLGEVARRPRPSSPAPRRRRPAAPRLVGRLRRLELARPDSARSRRSSDGRRPAWPAACAPARARRRSVAQLDRHQRVEAQVQQAAAPVQLRRVSCAAPGRSPGGRSRPAARAARRGERRSSCRVNPDRRPARRPRRRRPARRRRRRPAADSARPGSRTGVRAPGHDHVLAEQRPASRPRERGYLGEAVRRRAPRPASGASSGCRPANGPRSAASPRSGRW